MLLISLCTLFLFLGVPSLAANMTQSGGDDSDEVYIVYMGAASSTNILRNDHAVILNSVLRRNEKALVRNFEHGFSGFAAHLSKEEAASIAQKSGVVAVFPDPILKLQTTRSWDFLDLESQSLIRMNPNLSNISSSFSSDIVIGILDTGRKDKWREEEDGPDLIVFALQVALIDG